MVRVVSLRQCLDWSVGGKTFVGDSRKPSNGEVVRKEGVVGGVLVVASSLHAPAHAYEQTTGLRDDEASGRVVAHPAVVKGALSFVRSANWLAQAITSRADTTHLDGQAGDVHPGHKLSLLAVSLEYFALPNFGELGEPPHVLEL